MASGETTYALQEEKQAVIAADGTAWINGLGPQVYGERWEISATQTRVTGSTSETRLEIFRNGTSQIVEGTYSGNQDNSNTPMDLQTGEKLWYKWSNGTPGALVNLTVSGKRYVRGNRGY